MCHRNQKYLTGKHLKLKALTFDIRYRSNVIFGGQYEFIVDNPIGLMIQAGRWMQLNNLIVLYRQIMSRAFQMCNLETK